MVLDRLELARGHLAATGILLQLEADLLAFMDRAEAGPLHRRSVDEHVRAAVVRLNEAEALGGIEPLHNASRHRKHLSGACVGAPEIGCAIKYSGKILADPELDPKTKRGEQP